MVQASIATRSQSFDLVKSEIEKTIKRSEQGLEDFLERGESEDLNNCVDYLNQLRGIFILVELQGCTLLCQEAVALANEVPPGAQSDNTLLLTVLSSSLLTLRRYVDYFHREHADHPELLLPIINELREARGERPYPDSHFFALDLQCSPDFCSILGLRAPGHEGADDFDVHGARFRLMYQAGLLRLLHGRNLMVGKKLIGRAAVGVARLCNGSPMGQLWCLVAIVMQAMADREMEVEKPRKRLFMRLERYVREAVQGGRETAAETALDELYRDLVYILYRSGSASPEVRQVLEAYALTSADFNEAQLLLKRERLYGPGADALNALSRAVLEEVDQLKDKLDKVEHGIDPDVAELAVVGDIMGRLSNTLLILDLNQLSAVARRESGKLLQWSAERRIPNQSELYGVADAILAIEDAARQIVTHGTTIETERLAESKPRDETTLYLKEALIVVTDEARAALTLAKRAITAFLESDYDRMHLASLPGTLRSIWGGLWMLEDKDAAAVLARIAASIEAELLQSGSSPERAILEALADALTSLEYYIEGIGHQGERNSDLLKLANTSLQDAGL